MPTERLFLLGFAVAVAYLLVQVVRKGGLRGVMFGARLGSMVGEMDLGRKGLVRTVLKVHCLAAMDPGSPRIGVELRSTSFGAFSLSGIALTRDQASTLAALLSQAVAESDR